jgi:hypothetical protein
VKLEITRIAYSAYIKGNRFIAYFETAEDAMKYLNELYPTEDKHVEPVMLLGEKKQ